MSKHKGAGAPHVYDDQPAGTGNRVLVDRIGRAARAKRKRSSTGGADDRAIHRAAHWYHHDPQRLKFTPLPTDGQPRTGRGALAHLRIRPRTETSPCLRRSKAVDISETTVLTGC